LQTATGLVENMGPLPASQTGWDGQAVGLRVAAPKQGGKLPTVNVEREMRLGSFAPAIARRAAAAAAAAAARLETVEQVRKGGTKGRPGYVVLLHISPGAAAGGGGTFGLMRYCGRRGRTHTTTSVV
jgi:hypothetical protein